MRAGYRYECGECGRVAAGREGFCAPDCRLPRDENGNALPRPAVETFEWYGGRPEQVFAGVIRSWFRLAVAVQRIRRRRQLARYREAAGEVVPIARAEAGLVAIRGRVEILEPVRDPERREVAAYVMGTRTRRPGALGPSPPTVEVVTVHRAAGRFLVRDSTGVALVDDDWVELVDASGAVVDPTEGERLAVVDRQLVLVVGPACRGGVSVPAAAGSSYRGPPAAIRFDGGTGRPVCVVALGDVSPASDP